MNKLGALINDDKINLQEITFLLLDSNLQALDILGQVLTGFGVRSTVRCQTVDEAKQAIGRMAVDFVLTDSHLADDDGYAFLQWLRHEAGEPNRYVPAIVITSDTSAAAVRRARDSGAHFIVANPITPKVLLERIFWIAREDRMFIDSGTYVGPDRRFKRLGPPPGVVGRRSDDVRIRLGDSGGPNLTQDEINALMKPTKVTI